MRNPDSWGPPRKRWTVLLAGLGVAGLMMFLNAGVAAHAATSTTAPTGSWPMYARDLAKTGYDSVQTTIKPSNVGQLKRKWVASTGAPIFSQPIEANGLLYWGAFNGYEYAADPLTGNIAWSTFVGTTTPPSRCNFPTFGVVGTSQFVDMSIGGVRTPVLFVSGGNSNIYALNASTGAPIWQTAVGPATGSFIWGSPTVWNGSLYIGVASMQDCPLIQGQVFKLNAATGAITATFNAVPSGCLGGGVWDGIAVDTQAGTIYLTDGNPKSNGCSAGEPLAPALIELRASNLSLVGHWTIPPAQQNADSDFGSTPTLFEAQGQPMVGAVNKNGYFYAFQRGNLDAGPVWSVRVSNSTAVEPLATSSFNGTNLFVSGGSTTANGVTCHKSLWKLNPGTGSVVWKTCLLNGGLGAVSTAPGLVMEGTSYQISVFSTSTGTLLFKYLDTDANSSFWGSGSFSDGQIFFGNKDGNLYALGLAS